MVEHEQDGQAAGPRSGFFQLALCDLHGIVAQGGGHHEVAAYVVLCSGINSRQSRRYCTHGAMSVSKRTGLSYRASAKAIEWLHQCGFVGAPSEGDPKFLGKGASRATEVQCVVLGSDVLDVAVSQQFVEGVPKSKSSPPLRRLFEDVNGDGGDISRGRAVIDALTTYFALMGDQDFGACSGVSPQSWSERFEPIDEHEDGMDTSAVFAPPGMNGNVLVTVKETDNQESSWAFIGVALGVAVPEDDDARRTCSERYFHAIEQLRAQRLAYRVLNLWDGDPHDPSQARMCEPLATLYINDAWARKSKDPYVLREVHLALWRTEARDQYSDFTEDGGDLPFVSSGRYRYIVRSGTENRVKLVGQLRVRYWPTTESSVSGRVLEQRRTEQWVDPLSSWGESRRPPRLACRGKRLNSGSDCARR